MLLGRTMALMMKVVNPDGAQGAAMGLGPVSYDFGCLMMIRRDAQRLFWYRVASAPTSSKCTRGRSFFTISGNIAGRSHKNEEQAAVVDRGLNC